MNSSQLINFKGMEQMFNFLPLIIIIKHFRSVIFLVSRYLRRIIRGAVDIRLRKVDYARWEENYYFNNFFDIIVVDGEGNSKAANLSDFMIAKPQISVSFAESCHVENYTLERLFLPGSWLVID